MSFTAPPLHFQGTSTQSITSFDNIQSVWSQGVPASAAWPAANVAILVPFSVSTPVTVVEGFAYNGGTGGGNFDIGIYDTSFVRLTSSGATARSASAVVNTTGMTNYTCVPGRYYYMAMSCDGTSNFIAATMAAGICESMGVLEDTGAYVLPDPLTPLLTTRAFIPQFGLRISSVNL